jgi:hypothetical protein
MAVYSSFEQIGGILKTVFEAVFDDPTAGKKMKKVNIVVKYIIQNPDGEVWVDTGLHKVVLGPYDKNPTVQLTAEGDSFHDFLLKKVKITDLILKKKISAKGPFPKFMKMIPLLNKAYEIYPEIAEKNGIPVD